jgi:predicted O-methyltransferase YrrM
MGGASLLHCLRFALGMDRGETQTTALEREAIGRHAAGARRAAEIGVYEGVTTLVIAASIAPEGILYGVDPFFRGRLGISYGRIISELALRRARLRHKVRLVEKLSHDAAPLVREPLDFAFIDGDHRYEAIERDWSDWSAKIRPGGAIALHDTQAPAHDPGVADYGSARYFRETIARDPRFEVVESVDSLNVLRRVG